MFQSRLSSFIIKTLDKLGIPSVMSHHDYKILCPVYTHLDVKGNVCEKCSFLSYGSCVTKRCVEGDLKKSFLMAMESYSRDLFSSYLKIIDKHIMMML